MKISTRGMTNKIVAIQAATAQRITGLTLDQVQLAGIHCRLDGTLSPPEATGGFCPFSESSAFDELELGTW